MNPFDLGPHAAFIWASYAAVFSVIAALIVWLLATGAQYRRRLAELEARGVRRRSASGSSSSQEPGS